MNRITKQKSIRKSRADPLKDIHMINEYSQKALTPEEVFVFSIILCDNEIDRDVEMFSKAALDQLSLLFLGKSGIFNHSWDAKDQVARIYRTQVIDGDGKNQIGERLMQLQADAYMLRNEHTADIISKIEGGILKEISVGVAVKKTKCSICDATAWSCAHQKGAEYEGKTCYHVLEEPTDAYEFSFVAVPAQRGAGVTKQFGDAAEAASVIMHAKLEGSEIWLLDLQRHLAKVQQGQEEQKLRQEILEENKLYLGGT